MTSNLGIAITVLIGIILVVANVINAIIELRDDIKELKAEDPLYKQIRKLKEKGKWE